MKVPFLDLTRQYQSIRTEIEPAILGVLNSGSWILGEEVEAFEKEMADYLQVEVAIAVASGTDSLWLALKALGVGAGDKERPSGRGKTQAGQAVEPDDPPVGFRGVCLPGGDCLPFRRGLGLFLGAASQAHP